MTGDRGRYVIHLPVAAVDLPAAVRLGRVAARALSFLPLIDPGETTVSDQDEPDVRHPAFCDRRVPGGRRCLLRPGHDGPCGRRLRR